MKIGTKGPEARAQMRRGRWVTREEQKAHGISREILAEDIWRTGKRTTI